MHFVQLLNKYIILGTLHLLAHFHLVLHQLNGRFRVLNHRMLQMDALILAAQLQHYKSFYDHYLRTKMNVLKVMMSRYGLITHKGRERPPESRRIGQHLSAQPRMWFLYMPTLLLKYRRYMNCHLDIGVTPKKISLHSYVSLSSN